MKLETTTDHQPSRFRRIVGAPLRALYRARDLYVRSMGSCASAVGHGHGAGAGAGHYDALPRSFSVSPGSSRMDDSDDFRELLKVVSATKLVSVDSEARKLKPGMKSYSVGMRPIDEDKACEFEGMVREAEPKQLRSFQKKKTRRSSSLGNASSGAIWVRG